MSRLSKAICFYLVANGAWGHNGPFCLQVSASNPWSNRPHLLARRGSQTPELNYDSNRYPIHAQAPLGQGVSTDFQKPLDPRRNNNQQQLPPGSNYNNNDYNVDTDWDFPTTNNHETVQDRVDSWRQRQQEQGATWMDSSRDDQGRVKLLTSVSRGSRAFIFFCLLFRTLHLYEVADKFATGLARLLLVTPLVLLFLGNLVGLVASAQQPTQSSKKRLKAILNVDKLIEVLLILYNVLRLTIFPSKYTPREIYVAGTLHSFFFLLQCQTYTRLSWDENLTMEPQQQQPSSSSIRNSNVAGQANDFGRLARPLENNWPDASPTPRSNF
jgi:hypothetical protein